MGSIAYLAGAVVGGFLLTTFLAWLASKTGVGKDDEPGTRALKLCAIGWVGCAILSGWGAADGGPFVWTAGFWYVPGALLAWVIMRRRFAEAWQDEPAP